MKLTNRETRILKSMRNFRKPLNRTQISERSGVRLCSVCSAIGSLMYKGKVKLSHKGRCPCTGKTVQFLRVA